MGLSVTLSNALSGMGVSQNALEVVSRNVANAGTPGYHRQAISTVDQTGNHVRSTGVNRAFNQSLQSYYTKSAAQAGYANTRASYLDRVQTAFGKPGTPGSLGTTFADFRNALQALATSPDDYATRASVLGKAQAMADTLNRLTQEVQGLRRDTETRMMGDVENLNRMLSALEGINGKLADRTADQGARAALLDQRDSLVAGLSELIDIKVDYRGDGSVAISTRSGVGLLDVRASRFGFDGRGGSATGVLSITSFSGISIDVMQQDVIKSGELAALVELRDKTLVDTQKQLDTIAAGLAQALSSVEVPGQAQAVGAQAGFELDLSGIRPGNDLLLGYTQDGQAKTVRVVRVEDPSRLPMDGVDENGVRVIGLSFAGGAPGVAVQLQAALGGGLTISASGPGTLLVLDDGVGNSTDITALSGRRTVSGAQGDGLGLSLFVDALNADYTGSLDGDGQLAGFAGRIRVNAALMSNNALLVQYQAGGTLGDAARADYLLEQLGSMGFAATTGSQIDGTQFRLSGSVGDLVAQVMNRQGELAATAADRSATEALAMDSLSQRMESEYGVNVDEEMARLMELQNSYAANARVLSVVQELLDALIRI